MEDKNNKKNVFWLGVTSFFTDVSSEMIFAVLPIFLKNVLGAPFAAIGLIEGVAEGVSSFLKYFSGRISDLIKKRKPLAFAGYGFSTLSKILLIWVGSWPFVFILRILDRTGKGIRTAPRDALITESVVTAERGKYFGLHRAMDTAGAFLGVGLVVLIFYLFFRQFFIPEEQIASIIRIIFILAFFPALLALMPFFFIKEEQKAETGDKIGIRGEKLFNFRGFSSKFYTAIFILGLLAFGNISYSFFILKSQAMGLEIFLLPVLYLVYNFFYAVFSYPAGKFSDSLGRTKVLTFGFFTLAVVFLAFGFSESKNLIWFLFALYGFSFAVTDAVARAFISDLVEEQRKGESFGLYHMTIGLASISGNFLFGFLWDKTGSKIPFILAGLLVLAGSILLFLFFRSHQGVFRKAGVENFKGYRS